MLQPIYVLDLETTGLVGEPIDKAVEIGIARVDLERGRVYPEYSRIINQQLTPAQQQSWVFEHTDLTPMDVINSPHSQFRVAMELSLFYPNCYFTSYNRVFDFGKFIDNWNVPLRYAPCIKEVCAEEWNNGEWFKAQEAYNLLCPDNPAGLEGGIEAHRALSDAVMEGFILCRAFEACDWIRAAYAEVLEE